MENTVKSTVDTVLEKLPFEVISWDEFVYAVLGREDLRSYFLLFLILFAAGLLVKFLIVEMIINVTIPVNIQLADRAAYHFWKVLHAIVSSAFGVYTIIHSRLDISSVIQGQKSLFDGTIYSPYLVIYLLFEASDKLLDSVFLYFYSGKYKFLRFPETKLYKYEFILYYLVARFPHHILYAVFSTVLVNLGIVLPHLFYFLKSLKLEVTAKVIYSINLLVHFVINVAAFPCLLITPFVNYINIPNLKNNINPALFGYPPYVHEYLIWGILIAWGLYNVIKSVQGWISFVISIVYYTSRTTDPVTADGKKKEVRKPVVAKKEEKVEKKPAKEEVKKVKKVEKVEEEEEEEEEEGGEEEEENEEEDEEAEQARIAEEKKKAEAKKKAAKAKAKAAAAAAAKPKEKAKAKKGEKEKKK